MKFAFIVVSIILFVLDAVFWWFPNPPGWGGRLQSLGLAFLAASFAVTG